jgi:hypothetical protein
VEFAGHCSKCVLTGSTLTAPLAALTRHTKHRLSVTEGLSHCMEVMRTVHNASHQGVMRSHGMRASVWGPTAYLLLMLSRLPAASTQMPPCTTRFQMPQPPAGGVP